MTEEEFTGGEMSELKKAIRSLHRIYYSIDPFASKEQFLKLHHALEDCFNAADIISTGCGDFTAEEQFQTMNANNPPESLKKAWAKAKRGEVR